MRTLLSVVAICAIASPGNAGGVVNDIPLSMETTYEMKLDSVFARFNWQAMFITVPASLHRWGSSLTPPWAVLDTNAAPPAKRVKVVVERCGDVWKDLPRCVSYLYAFGPPQAARPQQQVELPTRRQ